MYPYLGQTARAGVWSFENGFHAKAKVPQFVDSAAREQICHSEYRVGY